MQAEARQGGFRKKVRAFLTARGGNEAVEKLRTNTPVTASDLAELERVLVESGVGTADDVQHAGTEADSLGLFIRGLVGLDRSAAKDAFGDFLDASRYGANRSSSSTSSSTS